MALDLKLNGMVNTIDATVVAQAKEIERLRNELDRLSCLANGYRISFLECGCDQQRGINFTAEVIKFCDDAIDPPEES